VDAAIDAGITLFDTADVYGNRGGSETLLGQALEGRRDEVVVATKFGMDMGGANGPDWGVRGSRRYIRLAVEGSLKRLGTDWIDLYQMHAPDPRTPIEETLGALTELVAEGKVRYIGSSNFAGWQVVDADWTAHTGHFEPFVSAQNEYSWLNRGIEAELVPALLHTGQSLLPYFPLASGLLTGKYTKDTVFAKDDHRSYNRHGEAFDQGETFSGVDYETGLEAAAEFTALAPDGATPAQTALRWIIQQPGVTSVIPGARSVAQARANAASAALPALPQATLDAVRDLYDRRIRAQVHGRW
jgi:aryl-alcohol dehydrogenase-like predicted oxidoreductase